MEDNTLTENDKAKLLAYTDVKNLRDCDMDLLALLKNQKLPATSEVSDRKRRSLFLFITGFLREKSLSFRNPGGIAQDELLTLLTMCLLIGLEKGRKLGTPLDQK